MNFSTAKLAYDLCLISSITNQECELLVWLESYFKSNNFICEKIYVDQGRYNLFVYIKKQEKYNIIFCTHIDTVGPYIAPRLDLETNILHGRGSCDAKGILASMIITLMRQRERNFDEAALLITVGEEASSDGAKAANNYLAKRANYVVVGEPTNLRCAVAQKGMLVFDIEARGSAAHSSLPSLGHSAIHELVICLNKLVCTNWPQSKKFGETFFNIGKISGGEGRNIISDYAQANIIMRLGVEPEIIIKIIKKLITKNLRLKILSQSSAQEFFTVPKLEKFCAGFGSDAPYLDQVGEIILCGPGDLSVAHTDHEHMFIQDLEKACDVYEYICEYMRGKNFE